MQRRTLLLAGLPWPMWAAAQGGTPWTDALARDAVALLADAASHGLDPADYDAPSLALALQAGTSPSTLGPRLGTAMQRYLHDLHFGRVEPQAIHHDFRPVRRVPFDAAAVLDTALATGSVAGAVTAAAPPFPTYDQLRATLARCRALATDPAWTSPLPTLPKAGRVEDLAAWAGVSTLRARLLAWGDLAGDAPLDAALQAFQRRHGLADDGVLGRATWAALQVTPAQRARQIELTLERLRWTPLLQGPRMIVVNIPEYVLRAYEVLDGRIRVQLTMKVVVGKAADTRTPLIDEDLRFIEFSPYWNVPPSIARKELVPRLRRDPGHWSREGFEFVGPGGQVDTALSATRLDSVLAGGWRIRQRPGPRNALGDIKFVFPNREAIYLHHTPSVSLFERARRDFSHGCIRIEQPEALAQWVLRDQPGWDAGRIRAAMTAGTSSTLALAAPIPVLIAYGTTLVKDGRTYFYDDVYGLDRRLDAALQTRPRSTPR
ncbi:L,D-transpeptidase family protein [Rubrivivax albus]|uniref:Murein L,D-transpeptidase n=1 Tax=Rubrivivax albus TaxID=2499835 RepID=A0A437JW69_9BURK|nr:L,D-transpeptidase family protein [Rubrivivax albus]RVT51632.1 murein L,D-transpeptidase [Rubrivivax albus]